jgi:hypothetical protein
MHNGATGRRQAKRGTLRCTLVASAIVLAMNPAVHADDVRSAPTQSDFGGAGLWQTPSARMAEEGEAGFSATRVEPYTRYNFMLQPLPWLEVLFRYTSVGNRSYGPEALSGHQHYKDKSIDAKVRLWEESRYLPDLSIGGRDIGGTGLFSGEYVVASKRFGPVDASLGLGWGYVGNRGDFGNPFSLFGSRFDHRSVKDTGSGGEFNSNHYFRGRTSPFGGVSYQTPWERLIFKLEYDGNDYKHEPQGNNQRQSSPFNLGAVFRANDHVDFSLALERGNTVMFGFNLHANLARGTGPAKVLDPPPPPRPSQPSAQPATQAPGQVDWARVSRVLADNAGVRVAEVSRRGRELVVTGEQQRYFYSAEGLGRTARVLDNLLGPGIDWFTLVSGQEGLWTIESSVHRQRFDALLDHRLDMDEFRGSVEQNAPTPREEEVLYRAPLKRYDGHFSLAYNQNVGGPDAFILYQIAAGYDADFHFTRNLWWSGALNLDLLDNYDKFKYDAPSGLPRVRTDIRKYITSSNVTMPVFQLTDTRQLGQDLYAMAYAGMLESMYGGAGGEVLYRPFGERWAIGLDANWVRQRGYDQDFSFRRYHVATGHLTGYLDIGRKDITVAVSAGRYLAGDWGATFDVSREFRNGLRMGAYATFTNVSSRQFGEGSFDKGIYISIPFDLMLPRSTTGRAGFMWQPLIRDGGARLNRRYTLYSLTSDRDQDNFEGNLDKITQ